MWEKCRLNVNSKLLKMEKKIKLLKCKMNRKIVEKETPLTLWKYLNFYKRKEPSRPAAKAKQALDHSKWMPNRKKRVNLLEDRLLGSLSRSLRRLKSLKSL